MADKKIEEARKSGYSDEEIVSYLAEQNPKFAEAAKAGHDPSEILKFVGSKDRPERMRGGVAGFIAKYPKEAASGAAISNTVGFLESLSGLHDPTQAFLEKAGVRPHKFGATEILNKASGVSDLPPEAKDEAEILNFLTGLAGPALATKVLKFFKPGLAKTAGALPSGRKSSSSAPPIRPKDAVQAMFEERAALGLPTRGAPPEGPSIQQQIVGENLPVSPYEVAEKALAETQPKITKGNRLGLEIPVQETSSAPSLGGRVERAPGPGTAISPVEFESEASGGRALNSLVKENASNERKIVSKLYEKAQDNYKNISSIYPELSQQIESEIGRLSETLKPNTAESSIIKTLQELQREIGDSTMGFREVPVSRLIRASDSLSGMANYELPFTGPKEILKRTASLFDQAALKAIESKGGNPDLLRQANKQYGQWADRFANDEISPYLSRKVNNPESLFRKSISDEGSFRAIEDAIKGTKRSNEYTNAIAREVAERRMGKFKSDQIGSPEYDKAFRNLKELIGDKRAISYDKAFRNQAKVPKPREIFSKTSASNKLNNVIEKVSKHSKLKPEDVLKKLNSRSGIKELKKEFSKESFDTMIRQKARSILQEGNIEHKFKGDDIYKVLNKESNFEIISEIVGREEAQSFLDAARQLKNEYVTYETLKSVAKGSLKLAATSKVLKFLFTLV